MSAGAAGVLRVPLVADGAVGRPGVDRVHRRHGDRRRARPQRPAPVALLRHEGRPGRHGVGGRRARHPGRGHPASRSGCTRAGSSSSTPRRAASSTTRRSSASSRRQQPYGEWLKDEPQSTSRTCREPPARAARRITRRCSQRQQAFGYTHEDLRILLGADGGERRGADRLDGHRHGAGGAVGPAAAALRLLQAAVRAGHQSAARRDPRGAGDVDGVDDRARRATCSSRSPSRAGRSSIKYPIIDNEQLAKLRHVDQPGFSRSTLPMLFDPAEGGPGLERAMEELCSDARATPSRPATRS